MVFRLYLITSLFIALSLISCVDKKDTSQTNNISQDEVTAKLLEANKSVIIAENDQIDKLILRNGWNMLETGTGLRYEILEKGNGAKVATGKIVQFEYEVKLITGEVIYSSLKSGSKEFKVGSGGVESGLEEGMLLLRLGDKARFIIPSYLAHGLSGDQDKIPPKATLIYTLKVINLN
jgi:FKBP-type peptidyl-prolyl cis-trans isomerase FkpA